MLLLPSNIDLVKQFLPKSYQRIQAMGSLQGALDHYRSELPPPLYDTLCGLIAPFHDKALLGSTMWPHELNTATQIDTVIHALLIAKDVDIAIAAAQELPSDALVAMLSAIQKKTGDAFEFAHGLLSRSNNPDIVLNAAQFLSDHAHLRGNEIYEISCQLTSSNPAALFPNEVVSFVEMALQCGEVGSRFHRELSVVYQGYFSSSAYVSGFTTTREVDHEKTVYRFKGSFQLDILAPTPGALDSTAVTTVACLGTFWLKLDGNGFALVNASIDIQMATEIDWYDNEDPSLLNSV